MQNLLKSRARQLRKNSTEAEKHLWCLLRDRRLNKYRFKRQVVIGHYIADFVCLKKKLVIELDGAQHLERKIYDKNRTQFLEINGFKVIRFWNQMVFQDTESVLVKILNILDGWPKDWPSPYPSPAANLPDINH